MARIKINKLPEGFELVDGKVKKTSKMKEGGALTGDQSDYGLVTTPQAFYGSTNFNNTRDNSVRHSLSRVPREDANIEAEGGETVLSDLNNNGQFGLYDINGPRHSGGGVPMFLPEQSFIYSDTNAMKFNKSEMAEFGIESKKKKTPADISKRYRLNEYLGEINSQYADNISTLSAELMLQKNMKNLSKLAFGQELKKKFEDGVPLAAYPYLTEQGIDPIEFAATIEETQRQEQELEYIASLPPEQQDQLLRMQAMMQQIDNPEQGNTQLSEENQASPVQPTEEVIEETNDMDMQDSLTAYAKFGGERQLKRYQKAGETDADPVIDNSTSSYTVNGRVVTRPQYVDYVIRNSMHREMDGNLKPDFLTSLTDEEKLLYGKALLPGIPQAWDIFNKPVYDADLSVAEDITGDANAVATVIAEDKQAIVNQEEVEQEDGVVKDRERQPYENNPLPIGHPKREAFETALVNGWELVETRSDSEGRTKYEVVKPITKNQFEDFEEMKQREIEIVRSEGDDSQVPIYGDNTEELLGIYEGAGSDNIRIRRGIYSGGESRPNVQPEGGPMSWGADFSDEISEKDFMIRWGDVASNVTGFDYQMEKGNWKGKQPLDAQARAYKKQWLAVQNVMQDEENRFAAENGITTPRDLFPGGIYTGFDGKLGLDIYNTARSYLRVAKPESDEAYIDDKIATEKKELDIPEDRSAEWWWQDMNNIATQNSLENPLFMPNIPKIPQQRIDYVLDDWTGKANMTNAAMNSMLKNLRSFGKGKVAGSNMFGKGVQAIAQGINTTNMNNVKIMNSVALPQANLNLKTGIQNAKSYMDEFDGSTRALQRYTDFENWDKQKSTELYNKAITNRANTDNLNKLKDYINISPNSGGREFNIDGKPLKPNPNALTAREQREKDISEGTNYYKDMNIDISNDPGKWLDYYIGNSDTIAGKKRQPGYGEKLDEEETRLNEISVQAPTVTQPAKKGKEIKPWAAFYTGAMGPNKR